MVSVRAQSACDIRIPEDADGLADGLADAGGTLPREFYFRVHGVNSVGSGPAAVANDGHAVREIGPPAPPGRPTLRLVGPLQMSIGWEAAGSARHPQVCRPVVCPCACATALAACGLLDPPALPCDLFPHSRSARHHARCPHVVC